MTTSYFHKHVLLALFASRAWYSAIGVRLEDEEQDETHKDVDDAIAQSNASLSQNLAGCDSTGGTCRISSCDSSRNSVCSNGKCICRQGECPVEGRCKVLSKKGGEEGHDPCGEPVDAPDEQSQMSALSTAVYRQPCTGAFNNPSHGWVVLAKWEEKGRPYPSALKLKFVTPIDAVGLYQKDTRCAVVFSGTNDAVDWVSNLWAKKKSVPELGLVDVHSGFFNEVNDFLKSTTYKKEFQPILESRKCEGGVISAGHSLGGAQASIFAAAINYVQHKHSHVYFPTNFKVAKLYTIGSPPPGFKELTNPLREDGVFDGSRAFNTEYKLYDIVPWVMEALGGLHPRVKEIWLKANGADVANGARTGSTWGRLSPCKGCVVSLRLHFPTLYTSRLATLTKKNATTTTMAGTCCYTPGNIAMKNAHGDWYDCSKCGGSKWAGFWRCIGTSLKCKGLK